MKIRKKTLRKLKFAFEHGMLAPTYPYTLRGRTWAANKKGYSHAVCHICDGYGCTLDRYTNYPNGSKFVKCDCELSGKGIAYTNKSYKNSKSLKRRFYFKDVCDLPDFIAIDESVRSAPDVVGVRYFNIDEDLCQTRLIRVKQHKNKKTLLIYSR